MTLSLPSPRQPPSASLVHIKKPRLKCHINTHLQQELMRIPGNSPTLPPSSKEVIKPVSFAASEHLSGFSQLRKSHAARSMPYPQDPEMEVASAPKARSELQ